VIVGVHGVGQQQLGRHQLVRQWTPALLDGLERARGQRVLRASVDVAYFGDLFLTSPDGPANKTGGSEPTDQWWEALEPDEREDLDDALAEALHSVEPCDQPPAPDKARTRVPGALRMMDRYFGPSAGVLYAGALRQVRRYLTDPRLKAEVDAAVQAGVTAGCRVVVAHSLGSVVAFEYLRRNPGRRLDALVTLGSPLGLRMVRRLMPDPAYGAPGIPAGVATWVNIRDRRDPVACAGPLSRWWAGVDDRPPVDNGTDAHSVTRYLAKRETGQAILAAVPELGAPGL
jgi:hypothetical protein